MKKQEKLDEQIQLEAIDLATDSILEADRKRREKEELRRIAGNISIVDDNMDEINPENLLIRISFVHSRKGSADSFNSFIIYWI